MTAHAAMYEKVAACAVYERMYADATRPTIERLTAPGDDVMELVRTSTRALTRPGERIPCTP